MNEKEIQHLESINSFYEKGDYFDEILIEREIDLIKQYPPYSSAIEIGCGNGYSTERLYKLFDSYEVVEPSLKNIELLKKRIPEILCHNFLLEDFIPRKKYDNVLFLNILEHVENPIKSLKSLINIVSDSGLIFISVPNCTTLNRRVGMELGMLEDYSQLAPKDYEVGHRRLYTVDKLKKHCIEADLIVHNIKGIYLKPFSEKQMTLLDGKIIRALHKIGEDIPEYCATLFAICTKKK